MAGGHKGKWTWIVKYAPNYFGRHGFKVPVEAKNIYQSINIGILDEVIEVLVTEGVASKKAGAFEVDLTKTDYSKVLGSGKVTQKLVVTAESFSPRAVEKIEAAGGKAVSVSDGME
ncbi:50S ribosomal protein L15P [archaeon BMS3Abin16]|nr:50S ribosomal protein L15P [archaeon BMS3Abin16]